jgi:L,D-transpeptidase catalytic domain
MRLSLSFFSAALAALALLSGLTKTNEAVASTALPAQSSQAQAAPQDPLLIVISLRKQRLSVFNKNGRVVDSPISSGTSEFPTPTGIFSIIGKAVEHESNLYEGAQMPFMQRLTWTGTAMHAGHLPGYPASHGCIRLPHGFSERLFGMTSINTRVVVTNGDVTPMAIAHPKLFTPPLPEAPLVGDQPMVSAQAGTKVASLAGIAPALAAAAPRPGQLPLTAKAVARFQDTALLGEAIKPIEQARAQVWDRVKAANRAVETARSDISSLQSAIDDAEWLAEKAKQAKAQGELALQKIMRKADKVRSAAALEALAAAETVAEDKLLDLVAKVDDAANVVATLKSGMGKLVKTQAAAEAGRRALDDDLRAANMNLKNAQSAFGLARREDTRYMKPISVLISRKDSRLYVRQGFEPVLEVPIIVQQPDQPLGTHVYTAMSVAADGTALS